MEPFGKFEAPEEYTLMKEEPPGQPVIAPEIAGAPPEEAGTIWKPSEETFTLGNEIQTSELKIVAGEKAAELSVEEVETVTEPDMGDIFVLGAEAEEQKPDLSYLGEQPRAAEPAVPAVELQFAPEEEYVPVLPPVEPVAPMVPPVELISPVTPVALQPSVQGELTLSEEQLASIVAKISREIIEKIAWEVVPDLAEMIIREEIRKIKEGIRE
jgi:hypothetical protein